MRRLLAGLLVALLAALTPVLSAAPASAARASGRTVAAPAVTTAAHSTSSSQQGRGLRTVGHPSPGTAGRRLAEKAGALRAGHAQRGGTVQEPTGPASSSIDATGPPSTYSENTASSSRQRPGACHYPAAAGRAPPSSCGS